MRFTDLVSRLDDETLQDLLGLNVVRLLTLLDPALATPANLRKTLFELKSPATLLLDRKNRNKLIDVLRPEDARNLADILRVNDGPDVYHSLKGVRIRSGSQSERDLFAFFEIPVPVIEEIQSTPACANVEPVYGLFAHQRKAAFRVIRKLVNPPRKVVLHMPTGAGKTRTAMHVIADFFRQRSKATVIWLAQTEELCEQAATEFERAWQQLGDRRLSLHRFWGDRAITLDDLDDSFVVAGLAKLYSSIRINQRIVIDLGNKANLVVIDEAHAAVATTYRMLLEALLVQNFDVALLGLTATPGRTWNDISADEELARFFARQKVTLEVPDYHSPIDFLINEGYLANPVFRPLLFSGGVRLSHADEEQIRRNFDIPDSILKRLAVSELRNFKVIDVAEDLIRRHKRVLVFAATVDHSELLAAALRARGSIATSITSKTKTEERARIIDEFKKDSETPMVLCNFGVLTTGFDAPKTSAAIIARPTTSLVLYSQMVGRAIRGPKAGGNDTAEIVTIVDRELPGFADISESFTNWEDVWETR